MQIIKINNEIIQLHFPTQKELCKTFLRFQEYYESPNPDFKGKPFTLGQFRAWYAEKYNAFTYYHDWDGMNIPSYVLEPFARGLFDPLTKREKMVVNLFKDRKEVFYLIGTCRMDGDALEHEICHGLYYTNKNYKKEVDKILNTYDFAELKKWLKGKGYCEEVLDDECHAYSCNDSDWLKQEYKIEIPKNIVKKLKKVKKEYFSKEV